MAGSPTLTYTYHFFLKPLGGNQFRVYSDGTNGGGSITDIPDAGTTDNLAVLGDISNDHFEFDGNSADTAVYLGQTSGGGIVSTQTDQNGNPFYNLSTNGKYSYGQTITVSSTPYDLPCFVSGTLIETLRGAIAVEALEVGDLVLTAGGYYRAIRWLGHRAIDCRRHPNKAAVIPVRIAAGAFGPGRPARDLLVSPGHAICVDLLGEVLIPASVLVNGSTIRTNAVESVTYWHVELDRHDILLSNGLPTESYLDMGNRSFFSGSDVVSLTALPDAPIPTHADFCRPFVVAGPVVDIVRARLRDHAVAAGWTLEHGDMADVHVVADGVIVVPSLDGLSARFVLPAGVSDVWLVSSVGVPSQIGMGSDDRRLGVCLRALTIEGDSMASRTIAAADPRLSVGFHDDEDGVRRWTSGRARLPASLWGEAHGPVSLRIDFEAAPLPHWVPAEREADKRQLVSNLRMAS